MPSKNAVYFIAAIAVGTLFVYSLVQGHAPKSASEWLAPIAPAVTAAAIGLWLWDRYLWRWPGLCRLAGRPVLDGTWHGELVTDWVHPETNERHPPDRDVFLVVRQRFWRVSVRLLTKESSSESTLAAFKKADDGVHQLVYVYGNIPRPEVRDRSEMHFGAVVLAAPRDPGHGIQGYYFTDRKTRGEMHFRDHYKGHADSYQHARELVANAQKKGTK
jgi:predicted pore-forming effector associated with SMODS systems